MHLGAHLRTSESTYFVGMVPKRFRNVSASCCPGFWNHVLNTTTVRGVFRSSDLFQDGECKRISLVAEVESLSHRKYQRCLLPVVLITETKRQRPWRTRGIILAKIWLVEAFEQIEWSGVDTEEP